MEVALLRPISAYRYTSLDTSATKVRAHSLMNLLDRAIDKQPEP